MGDWTGNNKIFRTFLKGGGKDGKACTDRHKGILNVRNYENASQFPSFGAVLQAGFIDISFDDREMSQTFLDMAEAMQWRCMVLENPNNGHIHTYWKDTQHRVTKYTKDMSLACGLVADIHGGETYIPLRVQGTDRFPPVYDIFEDEEYQEIPDELVPVSTNIKLWNADEGDGRNSDLYGYILILQSQMRMDAERISQMYREVINPYILKRPLSKNELDVILRDESFDKEILPAFYNGTSFLHDVFAEYIEENSHVVLIHGQLHIYKDGVYVSARRDIEAQMIRLCPKLRKTQRREAMDYLELIAPEMEVSDPRFIAFKNGIYDIVEDKLLPFTPDIVITNKIPHDYNAAASSEVVDRTLNKLACNDAAIRSVLEECAGAMLYRSALLAGGKAFILTGEKANGKSTFITMINKMLGEENISSLDLKEIGDRFSTSMIVGKLCNSGDDISDDFLAGQQVSIFKKVVTGNRLKAEIKGQDPFEFNPYCKLLFSANDIPRMKDKTGAVLRRLVIIPFNARFRKTDPDFDEFIEYKLTTEEAIQYLILCGIRGLKRVIVNKGYTESDKVTEQLAEYEIENNPIVGFINEVGEDGILHEETESVYRRYQVYCQDAMLTAMSKINFTRQVNKRLGTTSKVCRVNDRSIRIFER